MLWGSALIFNFSDMHMSEFSLALHLCRSGTPDIWERHGVQ